MKLKLRYMVILLCCSIFLLGNKKNKTYKKMSYRSLMSLKLKVSNNKEYKKIIGAIEEKYDKKYRRLLKAFRKAIYKCDSRIDFFQLPTRTNAGKNANCLNQRLRDFFAFDKIRRNAQATVALIQKEDLQRSGNIWYLKSNPGKFFKKVLYLGKKRELCKGVRFKGQPTYAFCSGVLAEQDRVVTARHCLERLGKDDSSALSKLFFVFGYQIKKGPKGNIFPKTFSPSQVYEARRVVRKGTKKNDDWAIIQLDRTVVHKVNQYQIVRPVSWGGKTVKNGKKVYTIGYPLGLPKKYAGDAFVFKQEKSFFHATLDAFHGNSGSPVFSQENHDLVGVLSHGSPDWNAHPGNSNISCVYAAVYQKATVLRSEKIVFSQSFAHHLRSQRACLDTLPIYTHKNVNSIKHCDGKACLEFRLTECDNTRNRFNMKRRRERRRFSSNYPKAMLSFRSNKPTYLAINVVTEDGVQITANYRNHPIKKNQWYHLKYNDNMCFTMTEGRSKCFRYLEVFNSWKSLNFANLFNKRNNDIFGENKSFVRKAQRYYCQNKTQAQYFLVQYQTECRR